VLEVSRWALGPLRSNCYLVSAGGEAVIIDPGWHEDVDVVLEEVRARGLKVKIVIATHGHFDHVAGVSIVKRVLAVPFAMHQADVDIARRAHRSAYRYIGVEPPEVPEPDMLLKEGDVVEIGGVRLRILETPGHTPGSITVVGNLEAFTGDLLMEAYRALSKTYTEPVAFTGDTLFKGTIGRVDLPGSSPTQMILSLRKIARLNARTTIYPGHGPPTTLAEELENNQYLKAALEGEEL
jgi:glyoxylase-like metal-dependent hydrolase (beta-lactamase superfamily II)